MNRNSRGNPPFCWLGGGGVKGHKNCEQTFCEQTGVSYKLPCVAKPLHNDIKYFRMISSVTAAHFHDFGSNYEVIGADLSLLIPYLVVGYTHPTT